MDPTSREDLSALMDGELGKEPARFLLRRMEHEPELAGTWSRWHLIRACLNAGRDTLHADPSRLVSAGSRAEEEFCARVLQAAQARPQARRHWARYLGGGAIAASVAAAALILSVPQTTSTETPLAAAPMTAPEHLASAAPRAGVIAAAPVSARRESASLPWFNGRPPVFLAESPAAASSVPGGGLLRQGYLEQAAYAPDAAPMLMPDAGTSGKAPYMILLMPGQGTTAQVPQH